MMYHYIHGDISHSKRRHSCEGRNPGKHWIPGQARNDKLSRTYVVMFKHLQGLPTLSENANGYMGTHTCMGDP